MTSSAKHTLAQFLALPETEPGSEFVDGGGIQKSMPSTAHIYIQQMLSLFVGLFLRDHPLGLAGPEWRCVFGPPGEEVARLPDFAFVTTEHLARDSWDGPHLGPPDLAVEILPPDDEPGEVAAKVSFYLANGVQRVWLFNPATRTVRVFAPDGSSVLLREQETLDGAPLLPGFQVRVGDLLPPPGPPGSTSVDQSRQESYFGQSG